jgi:hypothetical protein
MSSNVHAQFTIDSYGFYIGNSINAISVGYQDFQSMGLQSNFINRGSPEFSIFNPLIGASLTAQYNDIFLYGKVSIDDRSGVIEDELTPMSLSMHPELSYLTFEAALMMKPWDLFSCYGGPSISLLLKQSMGKIEEIVSNQQLTNMNSIIPGIFGGISKQIALNQYLNGLQLHISPYIEASLLFDQRKGEYPENQDGFDNIWSTFSMRTGFALTISPPKVTSQTVLPFTLTIPNEMAGKRSMNEFLPSLMKWNAEDFKQHVQYAITNISKLNQIKSTYCSTQLNDMTNEDNQKQRSCVQEYSILQILHHLNLTPTDTCIIQYCMDKEEANALSQTFRNSVQQIQSVDLSRIRLIDCQEKHTHINEISARFTSGHIPIMEIGIPSVSPSENVIICMLDSLQLPNEWFIDIQGPQQYRKTIGPLTTSIIHIDGSELLQGEAGAGAYIWSIRFLDEAGNKQLFEKDVNIRMTSESKMHAHACTYLPQIQDDAIFFMQLEHDLKKYLRTQDEILIIIDHAAPETIQSKAKKIQELIQAYIRNTSITIRREIRIIEKGKGNALYDQSNSWGRIYEQGIRVEMIH